MGRPCCARCCLRSSNRIFNLIMLFFGIGMITYSLWLDKKWCDSLNLLPDSSSFPKPWFIYACFGMSIAVCLSTILGQMVTNYVTKPTICLYISIVFCLLVFEVAVVIAIFRMNWKMVIAGLVDDQLKEVKSFLLFHVDACRVTMLLTLAAQMNSICLAVALLAVGPDDPRAHYNEAQVTRFTQSFLVPMMPEVEDEIGGEGCRRCDIGLIAENQRRNFSFYMKRLLIRLRRGRRDEGG